MMPYYFSSHTKRGSNKTWTQSLSQKKSIYRGMQSKSTKFHTKSLNDFYVYIVYVLMVLVVHVYSRHFMFDVD